MRRLINFWVRRLGAGVGLALIATSASAAVKLVDREPFDVLIQGGTILDGTGLPRRRADIGIRDGIIIAIGDLKGHPARRAIDAEKLFVAPGFINVHDHAAPDGLKTARNMLIQGVTTEIVNADGGGETDIRKQLSAYAASGLAVNVGANIGFNMVWKQIVGMRDVRPSAEQIGRMGQAIVAQLEAGAWGVSSGLDYKPAFFARPEEVVAVLRAAAPWRTYFQNHDRLSPANGFSSTAGMRETVNIAREAGLLPIITHMKLQGHERGMAPAMLGELRAAMDKGEARGADVYPYLAGSSTFSGLLLPGWALDGGYPALKGRLSDPVLRQRIISETEAGIALRLGQDADLFVSDTGKSIREEMKDRGVGMGEAIAQLLEVSDMRGIFTFGSEEDLRSIMSFSEAAISCDCGAITDTGGGNWPHPRFYGTFPRVLGRYVRETGVLGWEDAIRKMTGLPASQLGMVDRGYLMPGMAADIAIFDPQTIIDKATYANPRVLPIGMHYVLVNGSVMLDGGQFAEAHPGKVLLRNAAMPSRGDALAPKAARARVTLNEAGGGRSVRLHYSLKQGPDQHSATGSLVVVDGQGRRLLHAASLGLLQAAPDWASISGVAVDATGKAHSFILISDQGNPVERGGKSWLFYVDDKLRYSSGD